jgi:hypothetical protein
MTETQLNEDEMERSRPAVFTFHVNYGWIPFDLDAYVEAALATKKQEVCEWQQRITSDGVRWESACGWTMYAENPSDTVKATMCPCGKPIKVKEVQP